MTTKYIFPATHFILITFICYLGVKGFYQIVASRQMETPTIVRSPVQSPSLQNDRARGLTYYDKINKRNLFKTGKPAAVTPVEVDPKHFEDVEVTSLDLKLWGTISGNEKTARAVIEETKKREQNLYRVGDKVQGATVKMILREEVILTHNGKDQKLTLEDKAGLSAGLSGRSMAPFSARSGGNMSPASTQKISIRRSQIEDAMANVTELMGQIKIRPHFTDGQPDGLAVGSIKSRSIFRKMGLRNGDVITGIDGTPIETVDDAMKFYQNMMSASQVSVQIQRRGKERNIQYTIR